jgi:hypothetical protein
MSDYAPPVAGLMTLGDADGEASEWPDYLARGFTPQHVPDLSRLATDRDLILDPQSDGEGWAPIHALRLLGLLRAGSATGAIFEAMRLWESVDGDIALEDTPQVFALIGPSAIPALAGFLSGEDESVWARWVAADALAAIAKEHPESRAACVGALVGLLGKADQNEPPLNGGVISALLDLKAVEAAPAIEKAFATGNVDESIAGGWEEARYDLGLRPDPPPPRQYDYGVPHPFLLEPLRAGKTPKARAKDRAKRKAARKARKRNRKKK